MTNRGNTGTGNEKIPGCQPGTTLEQSSFRGNTHDIIQCFQYAMRQSGINIDCEIIADGRLHRFHIPGHTPGTLNGAYTLHMDGRPAGFFQNFCDPGSKQTWRYQGEISGSNQVKVNTSMLRMHRQKKEMDLAQQQEGAALTAQRIWEAAKPAPANHPYLIRKDIRAHGIRSINGDLVIPLLNANDQIVSLQFIRQDGQKRFLAGGKKQGCFFYIAGGPDRLMICEGVATGASLHEYTGWHVIVTFDAGNLGHVARLMRNWFPNDIIAIAGDNDESGVGQAAARATAEAVGGQVMIPRLPGDWNDWKSSIRGAL